MNNAMKKAYTRKERGENNYKFTYQIKNIKINKGPSLTKAWRLLSPEN